MENYKILIFPSAKQDLQDIVDYMNDQRSEDAFQLYDEIIANIGLLSNLPKRFPLMRSSLLKAKGYRIQVIHSYLVFYVVNGKTVEIRRILHGKRQYEFLI